MSTEGICDIDGSCEGTVVVGPLSISTIASIYGPSSVVVVGGVVALAVELSSYGSGMNILTMEGCAH